MSEARDCVVKLVDDHGVEHNVRVRAESVYEAAMKGARCPAAFRGIGRIAFELSTSVCVQSAYALASITTTWGPSNRIKLGVTENDKDTAMR